MVDQRGQGGILIGHIIGGDELPFGKPVQGIGFQFQQVTETEIAQARRPISRASRL